MYQILADQSTGNSLGIKITSTLTKQDYQAFIPIIEERIKAYGKINLLIQFENFGRPELGAIWEDLKFSLQHLKDFERIAIVGEQAWMEWMSKTAELFPAMEVKYFKPVEMQKAWQWVEGAKQKEGAGADG